MKKSETQERIKVVTETLNNAIKDNWSFDKVKEALAQYYETIDGHSVRYLCQQHTPHLLNEYATWWGNNKGNYKYTGRIKDYVGVDKLSEKLEQQGVRYDDPY